jgi:hypothetical protein
MLVLVAEIKLIEFPGYQDNRRLLSKEFQRLVETVNKALDRNYRISKLMVVSAEGVFHLKLPFQT